MSQPNQNMMGLVLQSPAQNTHMLVNVAGSTGFIGQPSNSMNPMGNMVQMQPQNHPNLHPVSYIFRNLNNSAIVNVAFFVNIVCDSVRNIMILKLQHCFDFIL